MFYNIRLEIRLQFFTNIWQRSEFLVKVFSSFTNLNT